MLQKSFIQEILNRVNIVDVIGQYLKLKRVGSNYFSLCPFHEEKSASFSVNDTKQFYHCFGCGAHGNVISFLMQYTSSSFVDALRKLTVIAGFPIQRESNSKMIQHEFSSYQKVYGSFHIRILNKAFLYYSQQLHCSSIAVSYLKKRGLTGKIAQYFCLGWSGINRNGLKKVFKENYNNAILVEAGLIIESKNGEHYDRFRNRIIFPIHNINGELIGFGGRTIGQDKPKYLNSPETILFSKRKELYGLWETHQEISKKNSVIVVEGYMDVIGLVQQGIGHVVATLGTSITCDQIKKLLAISNKIIFNFDSDVSGYKAAWRALLTCLPMLEDNLSIYFVFLPIGYDPDSYIRKKGKQAFEEYLQKAISLSEYLTDELLLHHDISKNKGRTDYLNEAKSLLELMPKCMQRIQIEHKIAETVQIQYKYINLFINQNLNEEKFLINSKEEQINNNFLFLRKMYDGLELSSLDNFKSKQELFEKKRNNHSFTFQKRINNLNSKIERNRSKEMIIKTKKKVPSLTKRLLVLLLMHPELFDSIRDDQIDILNHDTNTILVKELIYLARNSGTRQIELFKNFLKSNSPLSSILDELINDIVFRDRLPNPQKELDDAFHHIKFELLKNEMNKLALSGLKSDFSKKRYQELTKYMNLFKKVVIQ